MPDGTVARQDCAKLSKGATMLLVLGVVLLLIAIAGGVIIHPLLFLIAILALASFFGGRRGAVH